MKKNTLNVGVIGVGEQGIGTSHAKAVAETENAFLTWVCDIDEKRAKTLAEELKVPHYTADYHDMLKDPDLDAVIIATPDQLHREIVEAALAAKKHIMCEKPLALLREDIEAITKAVKASDRVFMVGQICRYTPGFYEAKKRIDAGEIGELTFIESEYAHDYTHILLGNTWRCDPNRNGVVGGACHAVDLLRWIAGNPEEITAYATHKTFKDLTPYDDTHIAIMKFPNGVIGKVFASISCRRDYTMRSVFYGTKGTIITDNTSPSMKVFHLQENGESVAEEVSLNIANHNTKGEFEEFFRCVVDGKPVETTVYEGANTIAACLAVMDSVKEQKPIKPKYFN